MINEPRITVVICICEECVEREELVLLRKCKQLGLRLQLSSVTRIVEVRVVNCLNFFPLGISQGTTHILHPIINHTPIGVHFFNELGKRLQVEVEGIHCNHAGISIHQEKTTSAMASMPSTHSHLVICTSAGTWRRMS